MVWGECHLLGSTTCRTSSSVFWFLKHQVENTAPSGDLCITQCTYWQFSSAKFICLMYSYQSSRAINSWAVARLRLETNLSIRLKMCTLWTPNNQEAISFLFASTRNSTHQYYINIYNKWWMGSERGHRRRTLHVDIPIQCWGRRFLDPYRILRLFEICRFSL